MKKIGMLALLAALMLTLCACGAGETAAQAAPDLTALYESLGEAAELPEMAPVPDSRREQFLGISPDDCVQAVTALCADSVRADEIWLIEAKDEAAADRVEELARLRVGQRSAEMENYLPDQYAVLQQAQILRHGSCVALFVSPEAEALAAAFDAAFAG